MLRENPLRPWPGPSPPGAATVARTGVDRPSSARSELGTAEAIVAHNNSAPLRCARRRVPRPRVAPAVLSALLPIGSFPRLGIQRAPSRQGRRPPRVPRERRKVARCASRGKAKSIPRGRVCSNTAFVRATARRGRPRRMTGRRVKPNDLFRLERAIDRRCLVSGIPASYRGLVW